MRLRAEDRLAGGAPRGSPRATCSGPGVLRQVAVGARAQSRDDPLVDEAREHEHPRRRPASRTSRVASIPSTFGIDRSMTTTSGSAVSRERRQPRRRRSPRRRPPARPAGRGRAAARCRTTSWSSATRTRIGPANAHLHRDRGALARRRVDRERAAERFRPLAHRGQPEPPGAQGRLHGSKPLPSSATATATRESTRGQRELTCVRTGVPQRVAERLLRDPQQPLLDLRRQPPSPSTRDLDLLLVQRAAARPTCLRSAAASPSVSSSAGRSSKISDRISVIAARVSSCRWPSCARALAGSGSTSSAAASAVSADREQRLRDRVVQLARQPLALLDRRQLAAPLVQAGVLDRDRRVRRERSDQLLVVVRELARRARPSSPSGRRRRSRRRGGRSGRRGTSACSGVPQASPRTAGRAGCSARGTARASAAWRRASRACAAAHRALRTARRSSRGEEDREAVLAVRDADRGVARGDEVRATSTSFCSTGVDAPLGGDRQHRVAHRPEGSVHRF